MIVAANWLHIGLKGIQNVEAGVPFSLSSITQSTATLHGNPLEAQMFVADQNSPVFVTCNEIDPQSAATSSQMTHKIFTHISYAWDPMHHVQPYFGMEEKLNLKGSALLICRHLKIHDLYGQSGQKADLLTNANSV